MILKIEEWRTTATTNEQKQERSELKRRLLKVKKKTMKNETNILKNQGMWKALSMCLPKMLAFLVVCSQDALHHWKKIMPNILHCELHSKSSCIFLYPTWIIQLKENGL